MAEASSLKIGIMPTGFGTAGGPRQAPDHPDYRPGPIRFSRYIVGFAGQADQLRKLLPAGLSLRGEPTAQFHFFCLRDIPWLAGRGYNILSMMIPVRYGGRAQDAVDGVYCAVMWENLGDPIITGREQLGHPKLYAQLPDPRRWNGETHIRAAWESFTFAEMTISDVAPAGPDVAPAFAANVGAGIIVHKYIPRSGQWDAADADYFTLSPVPGTSNQQDPQPAPTVQKCRGTIKFNVPQWQDMPTQYHIVQQLAALDQSEPIDALIMEGTTYLDFFDQKILPRNP